MIQKTSVFDLFTAVSMHLAYHLNNAGLPHTQGIFKLKKISGNFDLFYKIRENLIFSKKIQGSSKIFKISVNFFARFRMRFN